MHVQNVNVVYFDNAATTKPLNSVVEVYANALKDLWPNPSSSHSLGMETSRKFEKARGDIAKLLGVPGYDVIFTSGASEANNLALKGYMEKYSSRGKHLIVSSIEHPSVLNAAKHLESLGYKLSYVHPRNDGKIYCDDVIKEIRDDTILVSIMAVNNETGIVNNIKNISQELRKYPKICFHIDAVQAIGKIKLDLSDADMITISLHKLGGLKSSGLLVKKRNIDLICQNDGGGQESGIRSGTNDAAMAYANLETIKNLTDFHRNQVSSIFNEIYMYLNANNDEFEINSSMDNPYILNFSLLRKKASVVVEALSMKGIMVGSHSACSSKIDKGSYVLSEMGKNDKESRNTIRLSFGRENTIDEAKYFIKSLDEIIHEVRG